MIFACAFISIFGRIDPDSGSFHRSILISLRFCASFRVSTRVYLGIVENENHEDE